MMFMGFNFLTSPKVCAVALPTNMRHVTVQDPGSIVRNTKYSVYSYVFTSIICKEFDVRNYTRYYDVDK